MLALRAGTDGLQVDHDPGLLTRTLLLWLWLLLLELRLPSAGPLYLSLSWYLAF